MCADISESSWRPNDASNNSAPPLGFPEFMLPSGLNDSARQVMGATKRFWDRINGTVKATNIGNAYTYIPNVAAPTLADGEVYCFRIPAANTGHSTLDVGVGGAQPIVKAAAGGTTSLSPSDLIVNAFAQVLWDSLSAQFVLLNNPGLDSRINDVSAAAFTGGQSAAAGLASLDARITSQSALWTSEKTSLSAAIKLDISSVSAVIKSDISSVSGVIKLDVSSVSAAIKTDISSVSSVIAGAYSASDRSTSSVITTNMNKRRAAAWVAFQGDTGSITFTSDGSYNITSITRTVTGKYKIRYSQHLTVPQTILASSSTNIMFPVDQTTSFCKVMSLDLLGGTVDAAYVSVVVYSAES